MDTNAISEELGFKAFLFNYLEIPGIGHIVSGKGLVGQRFWFNSILVPSMGQIICGNVLTLGALEFLCKFWELPSMGVTVTGKRLLANVFCKFPFKTLMSVT